MHGGKRSGAGRKPGSRNKSTVDAKALVDSIFEKVNPEKTALELLNCRDPRVKSQIFLKLLEYRYGRAPMALTVSGPDGGPLCVANLSREEIQARVLLHMAKIAADPQMKEQIREVLNAGELTAGIEQDGTTGVRSSDSGVAA